MAISDIGLFNAMKARLDYLNQRQGALSRNIANANTPGYKSVDLDSMNYDLKNASSAAGIGLSITSPQHIDGGLGSYKYRLHEIKNSAELSPDGNNVDIEAEMVSLNENRIDYDTTLKLLGKIKGLLRIAIEGR